MKLRIQLDNGDSHDIPFDIRKTDIREAMTTITTKGFLDLTTNIAYPVHRIKQVELIPNV